MFVEDIPTIQLHSLDLRFEPRGPIVIQNVPLVAIRVPNELAEDFIMQNQGALTEIDM